MTDVTAPNQVQVLDRNLHWFSLTMLPTFNYGATNTVEVAVKTNGVYSGFGSPCSVSTPAVPTLAQCGGIIGSKGTLVYTTSLNRVTSYRFEITDMTTLQTSIIDRTQNWFAFNMISGATGGGEFAVRIAVMTSGVWSPFGEACLITGPGTARTIKTEQATALEELPFKATAYPSPYVESFALDITTSNQERIYVKVYDMVGKLLEERSFEMDTIEMQQFGERYASGVYNVIVSQGERVKTLRVIKR